MYMSVGNNSHLFDIATDVLIVKLIQVINCILHQYCNRISLKYHRLRNGSVPPDSTDSVPPHGTP